MKLFKNILKVKDQKSCLALLALIFFFSSKVYSMTLDQSQMNYNSGMSARTLPGYSEWQSFTAGLSGTLSEIRMGFFNPINGSGTLKIFSGSGTGGTLLQSKTVTIFCASGNCMITFSVSVPSISGQVYTFQFIPGAGIPDPYGVQVQVPGTYPGGQMGLVDPSGTYYPGFDLVFQTYVNTNPLPVELISFTGENKNNSNLLYWSTASEINNDYFVIERSNDGIDFEKIGAVYGNGNSTQILNYSFKDKNPMHGNNFYKLKQMDYNRDFTYSEIIIVNVKSNDKNCYIYESETPGVFILQCNTFQNGCIKIFDIRGKLIMKQYFENSNQEIKLNLNNQAKGILIANISNEELFRNIKLVKQ